MARTTVDCPQCRAKFQIDDKWHDADCPACQAHMEIDVSEPRGKFSGRLNCSACGGVETMIRASLDRMSPVVVLIGWVILAVSAIGAIWACCGFFAALGTHSRSAMEQVAAGFSVWIGFWLLGLSSAAFLLGSLLIMKKNVYQCRVCGFIMNRA